MTERITEVEHARRRRVIDQARHSSEMEGITPDWEGRALQEQYVAGEFNEAELVERTRALVLARNRRDRPAD
ncbi:hypothetical protein [Barrientosiimonas humi]|uniref:antitoxin VbhA family protein n=1 Tax=Barrientosiimonas humi TaxID=999931 RepID=UPI00370D11E7